MPIADLGALVTEVDVDTAVVKTLRLWLPTYLAIAEKERNLTAGLLARPKPESFANTLEDDEFLDHRLPAIIVTTAQPEGRPYRNGNGSYTAGWTVVVSAVVRGRTPPETRALAALFGGSAKRVLVQQGSLGGFASDVRWEGGNVAPVADVTDAGRYLAAGINQFTVYVDEVLDSTGPLLAGPIYDDPDPSGAPGAPYEPLVAVTDITVSVTNLGS